MNFTERTKRTALLVIAACVLCSLLMLLPPVQTIVLCLLEKIKGGMIRRPDLWRGRIRGAVCLVLSVCAIIIVLLCSERSKRTKVLYITLLICAVIPCFLFFPQCRIVFQQLFCGLTIEEATVEKRLDTLLYKAFFLSVALFLLAYLIRNFTFSTCFLKNRQVHTVFFSGILILSFISFYVALPERIEKLGPFCFYGIFDYGDYASSIIKRIPNFSYPPLANILTGLFKIFSYNPQQIVTQGDGGFSILSPAGSFMVFLFFLTHVFPLMLLCHRAIQGNSFTKGLFTLAICTSSFFVYAIMRGNIILLATSCSLYYMIFYESKDTRLRQTALLSLAIAANIKVYPAIFGCLLLKKKRWKDIGLCILYSILLFFPLFFTYNEGFAFSFGRFIYHMRFAGGDKISAPPPQVIAPQNTISVEDGTDSTPAEETSEFSVKSVDEAFKEHSDKKENKLLKALTAPTFGIFSLSNTVSTFTKSLQAPREVYSVLRIFSYLLYMGLSVLLFVQAKRKWILFLIPATACYLIPGMTYVYVPIFLLLPLIALLNEEDKRPAEYGALLLFLCMFACNWTIWPCVLGYRQFPSIAFSICLYITAFLTTLPVPENKRKNESKSS